MTSCIGGIFEFPWIALSLLVAHWKTGVAAVWGLGFAYVLFRSMRKWYKEDAKAAQLLCRNEDEIYGHMKEVARDHRSARLKYILTEGLLWLPLLAYRAGRKLASIVFYPILVVMDRAQKDAIEETRRKANLGPYTVVVEDEKPPAKEPRMEEPRCTKCGLMGVHTCVPQLVPSPIIPPPEKEPIVECPRCGVFMKVDSAHRCEGKGNSTCPDCGKSVIADAVHKCEARDAESEGEAFCRDCEQSYLPSEEEHPVEQCEECGKKHCAEMAC